MENHLNRKSLWKTSFAKPENRESAAEEDPEEPMSEVDPGGTQILGNQLQTVSGNHT